MNHRLKKLLDLWPQIVSGYHKSSDHYWQIACDWNILSDEKTWWLKHDGYCHRDICFGPFNYLIDLWNWDAEALREEMLDICRDELLRSKDPEDDRDMPPEHWEKLIEKLENL